MGDRNTNIIRGRETINMPEMVLEGGPAYTHVVLELPGFLAFDQLPVVMLFLSQLNDAAKKEAKPFLLTVHLLSDGTPVKNQLLTDETMTEIVKALTDAYFKRLEGGDEYILKEPEKEHQKLVEEKYKKELEGIATLEATLMQSVAEGELANGTYVDRRMLVRFIPDSMSFFKEPKSNVVTTFPRFHGDNAVTDIVTAGFSLLNDTYPLKLSPESNSASGFMKNFTDLTPCEAHQRLAGLFGGYFADLGRMPTNRLFESRPIADSFIFRNALRSVMEKGVYASDCSAEAAFETAANYYFNLPEEVFEKVTRGYGYRNYYTSLIAEGLLLFVGRKFHLPAKEDVIGSTSGYYEFLAEQSKTDKKAASYFLHDIINLYFRYEELREVHKGEPSFQGVVSEYLERMRATPLNFFEALYGVGGIDQDSWGEFDERPDKGKTMVWKNPWKFRDDVNSFRTLVTNFTRLPPEEKEREIDGIIKLLGAGYDNNVLDRDYNEVFLLAVDLVIEAIGTDEKLADKFARAVLSTVIFLKEDELRKDTLYPARVAEYLSQKWFPQFDSDRYLMTSDMAARLVEWTVSLKRLGENDRIPVFTKSICRIWNIAAGIISEEDRKKIQAPLTETVKNIFIDWARESINGKEKYKNYYKNPNDELDPVIFGDIKFSNYNGGYNWHEVVAWSASKLLNPDNIGKVLIGLTEAVPEIMEKQSDYLEPMLIFIFDACGETKSRMVIRYIMAKMPDCWRLVPLILKCASGFDDKKAVLIAIHEGLSAREDFWTFVRRIFNNEMSWVWDVVDALVSDDGEKLVVIYDLYYPFFEGEKKYQGFAPYFSDKVYKDILNVSLKGLPEGHFPGLENEEAYLDFIKDFFSDMAAKYYDDAVNGEAWDKAFKFYLDLIASSNGDDDIDYAHQFLSKVFRGLPCERSAKAIGNYVSLLQGLHGKRLEKTLGLFADFLERTRYYGANGSCNGALAETLPLFELIAKRAMREIDPESKFYKVFYNAWYEGIRRVPEDVQFEAFIYFVCPLASLTMRKDYFLSHIIREMLESGFKDGDYRSSDSWERRQLYRQEKAFRLGKYIAKSRYSLMLPPYIFGKDRVEHEEAGKLLMGFMEGAREMDYSDADIEDFARYAVFSIFGGGYGYQKLLPAFLKGEASRRFYKVALMPIRDLYIKLGAIVNIDKKDAKRFEEIIMAEYSLDLLKTVLNDSEVPEETKKYILGALKQMMSDTTQFNFILKEHLIKLFPELISN